MLVALGADIDRLAETEGVQGDGRFAGVKILGERREDLAALGFNEVAPEFRGVQMAGLERALEREMVFLVRRERIELGDLETEQIREVVGQAVVGGHVIFVHERGVEAADERAAVLHIKFQTVGLAAGEQVQRRHEHDLVF